MLGNILRTMIPAIGALVFGRKEAKEAPSVIHSSPSPVAPAATAVSRQHHTNTQAAEFFNQIKSRRSELSNLKEPALVSEYISKDDLMSIYDYILLNQNTILSELASDGTKTSQYRGHRIEKEKSKLARSISILKDLSDQFILILDIKRKLSTGEKSKKTKIFSGGNKTGKIAWRIDSPLYEKWINLVTTRKKQKKIQETDAEAKLSQELAQRNRLVDTGYSELLFSYSLESQIYHNRTKFKQAHYAPFVEMDFDAFLKDKSKFSALTMADKYSIADQLLKAIQIMHQQNIAHQDIKEANILIYSKNGKYHIKITDYGHSTNYQNGKKESLATAFYASPEIALAYKSKISDHYEYFHKKKYEPYGVQVDKVLAKGNKSRTARSKLAIEYRKPDLKNDMWSIGMVLYHLFNGSELLNNNPVTQKIIDSNPLLKGLLEPIRENRFNIQQALESLKALRNTEVALHPKAKVALR